MQSRTIDFTRQAQGQAIHGEYMYPKKPDSTMEHLKDKLLGRRRYMVPVDLSPSPRKGDKILYTVRNDLREAVIVDVEQYGNPPNMFCLEIVVTRRAGAALKA